MRGSESCYVCLGKTVDSGVVRKSPKTAATGGAPEPAGCGRVVTALTKSGLSGHAACGLLGGDRVEARRFAGELDPA